MDSFEDNQLQLRQADHRSAVAVATACAERSLGLYESLGSGDPDALKGAVQALWAWVDGQGDAPDVDDTLELLGEYADAHYEEGDDLLGHVVTTVIEALEVYSASTADEIALHAARALEANAELAEECDALLLEAGAPTVVTTEEERWRVVAIGRAVQGSWGDRATLLSGGASWVPAVLAAV